MYIQISWQMAQASEETKYALRAAAHGKDYSSCCSFGCNLQLPPEQFKEQNAATIKYLQFN